MSGPQLPLSGEYDKGSTTAATEAPEVTPAIPEQPGQTPFAVYDSATSTQTRAVGKPFGSGKPYRVITRGKISSE
jgi:hypothetical protein